MIYLFVSLLKIFFDDVDVVLIFEFKSFIIWLVLIWYRFDYVYIDVNYFYK